MLWTAVLLVIVAGQAIAHIGAMGVVKERIDAMSTLSDHSKKVGNMLKGKEPFDLVTIAATAQAFMRNGEKIPSLFPDTEESRQSIATEALPAIWDNWEEFLALSEKFTNDSQALLAVTDDLIGGTQNVDKQKRAVRAVFFEAAENCLACHK